MGVSYGADGGTTMTIPDAAIEATATHLFLVDRRLKGLPLVAWEYATEFERTYFHAEALLALNAAMPAIREHIAQELLDKGSAGWLYLAARIVRGGTQ